METDKRQELRLEALRLAVNVHMGDVERGSEAGKILATAKDFIAFIEEA